MFELRNKTVNIKAGTLYPNSAWESKPIADVIEAKVVIRGLVYTTRSKTAVRQEPYAYISAESVGLGIWLNDSEYEVLSTSE